MMVRKQKKTYRWHMVKNLSVYIIGNLQPSSYSHYDMEKVQRPALWRTLQANGDGNGVGLIY